MKTFDIGIDLDGVCYDFAQSLREYLSIVKHDYTIFDGEPDHWHFYLDWGMTQEEFINHCNSGVSLGFIFERGEPRDMAPDAIHFMKNLGHKIHIVTDRSFGNSPGDSQSATRSWLYECNIPYDSLTFSADKTCVKTDFFVEDKIENYDALDAAGVQVYLVNRPWNLQKDNRRRIKSIQEFATIVGNLSF